jgi:hypothetical protein
VTLSPTSRGPSLALFGLVLLLLGFDLWAVLVDQRCRGTDNFVHQTLWLHSSLQTDGFWPWFASNTGGTKGPLAALLAFPFLLVLGEAPQSIRLVSVLAHGALTLQCYDLGRRIWGRPGAGLWAALICGTTPLVFGLCRLTHHEVLVAVAVAGTLQLMLRLDVERPKHALVLGLVCGLGLLVKISFATYLAAPAVWLLARRARSRRALLGLGLSLAVALALLALWALPNLSDLGYMSRGALAGGDLARGAILPYYRSLPGLVPLVGAASLAAVLLGLRRKVGGWELALICSFAPMLLSLALLNPWGRYTLPALPLCAVLVGIGVAWLMDWLPRMVRRVATVLLAAALLALFGGLTLRGAREELGVTRELWLGMLAPDRRAYGAYPRMMEALLEGDDSVLVAYDSYVARNELLTSVSLWRYRGLMFRSLSLEEAQRQLREGRRVAVLVVRAEPERQLAPRARAPTTIDEWMREVPSDAISWLAGQPGRRRLLSARDPDGIAIAAYHVFPAQRGGGESR